MSADYSLLGLCRKAGKLAVGHDAVIECVRKNTAQLIILTSDASVRHKKEITEIGYTGPLAEIKATMDEIYLVVGKRSCLFAVTDTGFAKSLIKKFNADI